MSGTKWGDRRDAPEAAAPLWLAWGARAGSVGLLTLVRPDRAFAHAGQPPEPHDLWTAWSIEPQVLLSLAIAGWVYARGVRTLWRRAGAGRGISYRQVRCFAAGLAVLAIALISPVDSVGSALFSVHMVQHLLLTLIAAPLLALGSPFLGSLWGIPRSKRRALGRWWRSARGWRAAWRVVSHPMVVWCAHTVVLWAWHLPVLYESALRDDLVHALEHASFFVTAFLFWWLLIHPGRHRLAHGLGVIYLFGAALQSGILGALIVFAPRPWYAMHYGTTRAWGLTPLEDQQLAGLIMWVPASLVYLIAIGALLFALLDTDAGLPASIRALEPRRTS